MYILYDTKAGKFIEDHKYNCICVFHNKYDAAKYACNRLNSSKVDWVIECVDVSIKPNRHK